MKGWKTIVWNLANAVVLSMDVADTAYSIPNEWQPYWLAIYVIGNIALRMVTTTPVFQK